MPSFNLYVMSELEPGDLVDLSTQISPDVDTCLNYYDCPFYFMGPENQVVPLGWSDGGAGGEFGYIQNGVFTAASEPGQATHYRCPPVAQGSREVELTLTVDDIPTATDPATGETISTHDDTPVTASARIWVLAPHQHAWEAVDNLGTPSFSVDPSPALIGTLVQLQHYVGMFPDSDRCLPARCSFSSGYWGGGEQLAYNNLALTAWSDGGAGGQFGYQDAYGQFHAAQHPWQVTHYLCPTEPRAVQLSLTVDDEPTATDPETGQTIPTYDDQPATAVVVLTVQGPPPHAHYWDMQNNLPQPQVWTGGSALAGVPLPVRVETQADTDQCYSYQMQQSCPFPGGVAQNGVRVTGWSDGSAGGQFGYLDALGSFVASSAAAEITHYLPPMGGGMLGLTATIDDVPTAVEPGTGETVATYDDTATSGFAYLEVHDSSGHTHSWAVGAPLATPVLGVEKDNPAPEEVIQLSLHAPGDWDECTVYNGCPLANRADNAVLATAWSDGGAGGQFGYLDSLGTFVVSSTPGDVTHYRCPASGGGNLTLSVTVDDVPQTLDPATGQPIATYDDGTAGGSASVEVMEPDDHGHEWELQNDLPAPQLELSSEVGEGAPVEPGTVIPVGVAAGQDDDLCLDPDLLPCAFPNFIAANAVEVVAWSDGGAGGEFGYLDGQGQFVAAPAGFSAARSRRAAFAGFTASTDPALITHYRLPAQAPTNGTVTLAVTVDDIPLAQEIITGYTVPTYNDAPATASRAVAVGSSSGTHTHAWGGNPINADQLNVSTTTPQVGQTIDVRVMYAYDEDYCTTYPSYPNLVYCPVGNRADNAVKRTGWNDGGAGGQFGYMNGSTFVQVTQASEYWRINTYKCPTQSRTVTLSVTLDDDNWVDLPSGRHYTYDDPSVTRTKTITVGGGHAHQWFASHNIPVPYLSVSNTSPRGGDVVQLTATVYGDTDTCTVYSPACSFGGNYTMNVTRKETWTASVPGGKFGYMNGNTFTEANVQDWITAYQCPPVSSGTAQVRLTLTVNDLPQAYDPARGTNVTTFDDNPVSVFVNLTVSAGSHVHSWESLNNISVPTVSTNTDTATSQELVTISATLGGDTDRCTVYNPSCSFSGNQAANSLTEGSWSDNGAGGQFGYMNGSTFVASSLANQVTRYKCPTVSSGTMSVTLRRTVDDVAQALDPATGQNVNTYNDTAVTGTRTITVRAGHQHQWQTVNNIPTPTLNASPTQPQAASYVSLTPGKSDDSDLCLTYSPACPFPSNTAPNTVTYKTWSDGGAGGQFGKFVNNMFVSCPAAEVTHYRCAANVATPTNANLTLTVDDDPYATEPGGPQVGTYDDQPASVVKVIQVQPQHTHQWTSDGNRTSRTVTLVYEGTETAATTVTPCQLLEVRKGALSPDWDTCTVAGCSFPSGHATETTETTQTKRFHTDRDGLFGTKDARGKFYPVAEDQIDQITHFQVGAYAGEEHVSFVLDDTGKALDPITGGVVNTYDDPAANGPAHVLVVAGEAQRKCTPRTCRALNEEDICQCECDEVPIWSSLNPNSGALSFDVPVTGWSYRGLSLGFSLAYSSNLRADPTLDVPHVDEGVTPQANLAHLSSRTGGWTHSWAQFVEVVENEEGEPRALWHTGDGGVVSFDGAWTQSFSVEWSPRDSYHSLASTGTATTNVPIPRAAGVSGGSFIVAVPYGQFVAKDGDGTTYEFTQVHWEKGKWAAIPYFLLKRVIDRYGRTIQLIWDGDRVRSVKDGAGRGLAFEYAGKTLSYVMDPFGRTHRFTYANFTSEWGRPEAHLVEVKVEGPGSPRVSHLWKFNYGTPSHDQVTWKREPNGKEVAYTLEAVDLTSNPPRPNRGDWDGRLVTCTTTDPTEGVVKTISRQVSPGYCTITYPEGNQVAYTFDGGFMTRVQDVGTGRYVRYEYDTLGNLEGVWSGGLTSGEKLLAAYAYQMAVDQRTILKVTATGPLTATHGDQTEVYYGPWNLPYRAVAGFRFPQQGGQGYHRVVEIARDLLGNVLTSKALGPGLADQTSYSGYRDDLPTKSTDSVGRQSRLELDPLTGQLLKSYSPPNLVATADQDDRNPSESSIQYTEELPTRMTDPLGRVVELTYEAEYAGSPNLKITMRRLVDLSKVVTLLSPSRKPLEVTNERGIVTRYQYNQDGRPLRMTEAVGRPEQRTTRYVYNRNGDLVELINPRGASTKYSYTRFNQAGQVSGPYEGQVTQIEYPDGTREFFGYHPDTGDLQWTMRPYRHGVELRYQIIDYVRDELGRVVQTIFRNSPQSDADHTQEAEYDEFGQVVRTLDAAGETTYTYDGLGRVTHVAPGDDRKDLSISYVPEPGLHRWKIRTTLSGVAGAWETREDGKGRTAEVVNPKGQTFQWRYDKAGRPLSLNRPNRTSTRYAYTSRDFLAGIEHWKTTGSGTVLWAGSYQHDLQGRVTGEVADGWAGTYDYDGLGRLVREFHPNSGEATYQYDANDNRTKVTRPSGAEYYGYDVADKLLWTNTARNGAPTKDQPQPYSLFEYDAFGQMTWRERKTAQNHQRLEFRWDSEGRLREVKRLTNSLFRAEYAGDGQRVKKWDNQTAGHTYSFGLHDSSGNTLFTPGLAEQSGANAQFYLQDWRGSTRVLTDNVGGKVADNLRYDGYGQRVQGTGAVNATAFQFAGAHGYEREPAGGAELGLDYLYQRYYDPAIGRFISRDPIGYAGGLNLYGYCQGDPINAVDPSGLAAEGFWDQTWIYIPCPKLGEIARFSLKTLDRWGITDAAEVAWGKELFTRRKLSTNESIDMMMTTVRGNLTAQACKGGSKGKTASAPDAEPQRFIVRRYMNQQSYKNALKRDVVYDPNRGTGIPTTSAAHPPVDPDHIKKKTGAASADYYIDYDVTGYTYLQMTTKERWPEYRIQQNLLPGTIVEHGRVPKYRPKDE